MVNFGTLRRTWLEKIVTFLDCKHEKLYMAICFLTFNVDDDVDDIDGAGGSNGPESC